jgi:hypothetical protein
MNIGLLSAFCAVLFFASAVQAADSAKDLERQKRIHDGPPSATLDFEAKQIGLLLGGEKGTGVLHFKGKNYPFTIKGAAVGSLGYSEVAATGRVYFLNKLEDFAGVYGAARVGVAAGEKGAGGSSWQNEKEVVLILSAKEKGAALNLSLSAMEIQLAK